MLSAVLFIAGAIALIAGVAYFIFTYGNFLIGFINSFFASMQALSDSLPEFLLPSILMLLAAITISVLLKLL